MFQPVTLTVETLTVVSDLLRVATFAIVGIVGWIVKGALEAMKDIQKQLGKHAERLAAVEARVSDHVQGELTA